MNVSRVGDSIQGTVDEVGRHIGLRKSQAAKSVEEVEREYDGVRPKLDRLRGVRDHIANYLDSQSMTLQDRLVVSFQGHMDKLARKLAEEVGKFDLSDLTRGSMVWKTLTDWTKDDKDKFAKVAERCLKPQIQKLLERHISVWQQSVVNNEMRAGAHDVEKHLQEEAAEYLRVMGEIEQQVGASSHPLKIKELVQRWLRPELGTGAGPIDLPGMQVLSDLSFLIGAITFDLGLEFFLHLSTAWLPILGVFVSAARIAMRDSARSGWHGTPAFRS